MIFIACAKLLYVQYLNSAVYLLPYFDCHVLWDKFTANSNPAMVLLYYMSLQLYKKQQIVEINIIKLKLRLF